MLALGTLTDRGVRPSQTSSTLSLPNVKISKGFHEVGCFLSFLFFFLRLVGRFHCYDTLTLFLISL